MNGYIEDLDYLVKELEKTHPDLYRYYKKEDFQKDLDNIRLKSETINDTEFYKSISELIPKFKDGHTFVHYSGQDVPVFYKLDRGKLYVNGLKIEAPEILYKEVIEINDIKVDKLLETLESFVSYDTINFRNQQMKQMLVSLQTLKKLGVVVGEKYKITYLDDEKEKEYIYDPKIKYEKRKNGKPFLYYDYKKIDQENILHIEYKVCSDQKDNPFKEFVKKIEKELEKHPRKVIVDIRGNQGGNSSVVEPLMELLKEYKNNNGEVIGLIDERVFSSGTFTLLDLKRMGAYIIGNDTAGSMEARFGNVVTLELPNTKIHINCSNKEFTYSKEKQEFENTTATAKGRKPLKMPLKPFSPDLKVTNSIEDIRAGYDRVLDIAVNIDLNIIKETKIKTA